jgi:hypothetical protein
LDLSEILIGGQAHWVGAVDRYTGMFIEDWLGISSTK